MKYLLDTNVVSEIQKKKSNSQVAAWFSIVHSSQLHLSCITYRRNKKGNIKISKER